MKNICWNVRGLGSPRAERRLRHLCKQYNPQMVFLMETKLDRSAWRGSGGVRDLDEGYVLHGKLNSSFSKWHIDTIVKEENVHEEWRFTGFYCSPYLKDKNLAWSMLKNLAQGYDYPWLVAGDFNEIMYSFEKRGGVPRDHRRMEAFRDTLEECQLLDVGYSGAWFTWERGNLPETNIRERLDRGVANDKWLSLFPRGSVQHLAYSISDHYPILINTNTVISLPGSRRFHFESWWIFEDSLEGIIRDFWDSSSAPLVEKMENLQICLKKWACAIKSKRGS
ncbi:reverse transcriptase [Gossypium australe]|uniref:Reverse transcriptase n=1 Tax=Gossypium australe TaxID=47621 RepID=A0A5B6X2B4_9ROSI|nr:reverse transcriptase [Gossypium australe]